MALDLLGIFNGEGMTFYGIVLAVVLIWDMVWKLMAMWRASRKHSPVWFVVLAVFNTAGILPILYLYVFSKMKFKKKEEEPIKRKRTRRKKRR